MLLTAARRVIVFSHKRSWFSGTDRWRKSEKSVWPVLWLRARAASTHVDIFRCKRLLRLRCDSDFVVPLNCLKTSFYLIDIALVLRWLGFKFDDRRKEVRKSCLDCDWTQCANPFLLYWPTPHKKPSCHLAKPYRLFLKNPQSAKPFFHRQTIGAVAFSWLQSKDSLQALDVRCWPSWVQ